MTTITLWDQNSLWVTVSGGVDGLTFHAQDLNPTPMFGDEYEYTFSVSSAEVPKLVQALGGSAKSQVLELLQRNAEPLIRNGIRSWIEAHGITVSDFQSWF